MDEGDVVAGGAASDAAGGEAHALALQVPHRHGQLVDPEANVVERRHLTHQRRWNRRLWRRLPRAPEAG